MKVSILSPDLSGNCLGRAYILAKILQEEYEVEIVGPLFGKSIWGPLADDKTISYKLVEIKKGPGIFVDLYRLYKKIDGDIIYASKPLSTSFGLGLIKKIFNRKPLILDIDDWQMGFIKDHLNKLSILKRLKYLVLSFFEPFKINSFFNAFICERLIRFAHVITVSNEFLQKKFGGVILYHVRDTDKFDPEKYNKNYYREKYNIDNDAKVIMFLGTVRRYKGIEELIKAIEIINDSNIILVIVGSGNPHKFFNDISLEVGDEEMKRIKFFNMQPFIKIPEFLSTADVVVIPQKKNISTIGQIPAKLFDAMSMGKTIISTDVSDIPEILNGCGLVIKPDDVDELCNAIKYVFNNPEIAVKYGEKARKRCIDYYSLDVAKKILIGLFKECIKK